jgi:hypothetical protein
LVVATDLLQVEAGHVPILLETSRQRLCHGMTVPSANNEPTVI